MSPPIPSQRDGAFLFIYAHTHFLSTPAHNVCTVIRCNSSASLALRFQGAFNDGHQARSYHRAITVFSVQFRNRVVGDATASHQCQRRATNRGRARFHRAPEIVRALKILTPEIILAIGLMSDRHGHGNEHGRSLNCISTWYASVNCFSSASRTWPASGDLR